MGCAEALCLIPVYAGLAMLLATGLGLVAAAFLGEGKSKS